MAYSSDLSSVDSDNHQELQILETLTHNSAAPAPSKKTSEPLSRWDLWDERGLPSGEFLRLLSAPKLYPPLTMLQIPGFLQKEHNSQLSSLPVKFLNPLEIVVGN